MVRKKVQKLPSFQKPPLVEVVYDIYFSRIEELDVVKIFDISGELSSEFPGHEEKPRLAPKGIEVFGSAMPMPEIKMSARQPGPRIWLSNSEKDELFQIQDDRIIFNWRRIDKDKIYPRFEEIFGVFSKNLKKIQKYFGAELKSDLDVQQCEIKYLNVIDCSEKNILSDWVSAVEVADLHDDIEATQHIFVEEISDEHGLPFARLYTSIQHEIRQKRIIIDLTVRGMKGSSVEDALVFLREGREKIVLEFEKITSAYARKQWQQH